MNRSRRHALLHWTVTVVLAVLVGLVVAQVIDLASDARQTEQALDRAREQSADRQDALDVLAGDLATTRDQLEDLGETPRAPERDLGELVVEGPPGERGPRGLAGRQGPPGPRGDEGRAGEEGLEGASGPAGEDGAAGDPGPAGEAGAQGAEGPPGPAGPTGETGPAGADGADGDPGPAGPAGDPGDDGEPPASWTYRDQAGRTYRCTRVDDFDSDQPRYSCSQTDGPGASS